MPGRGDLRRTTGKAGSSRVTGSIGRATRLFILVVALVAAACGGGDAGSSDDVVVESSDGVVALSIPPGALPDGVNASEITITTLSIVEAPEPGAAAVTLPVRTIDGPTVGQLVSDDGTVELINVVISNLP